MKLPTRQERPQRVRQEDAVPIGAAITRATVGLVEGGLRVVWSRLDDGEAADLIALTRSGLSGPEKKGGFNADLLDKKQAAKWERLVEKGSDSPQVFASYREQAKFEHEIRALAKRARQPEKRPRYEEQGSVVIPRAAYEQLAKQPPHLLLADVGLYVFVMLQLENGQALCPGGSIEGDRLVISDRLGIGARYDPDGRQTDWRDRLQHLARNHWLSIERRGPEWLIGRGPTTLKVQRGRRQA